MRIVDPERFLGLEMGTRRLVLSKSEREILRKAAAIFDAADTMLTKAGVDQDDYDVRGRFIDGWDHCRHLADEGEVFLPEGVPA